MNVESIQSRIDGMKSELRVFMKRLDKEKGNTVKFLEDCATSGLTKVSIRRSHKSIPESQSFPFGPGSSVFGIGPISKGGSCDKHGWPAIWGCVERSGFGAGCGGKNQYQIKGDSLIDGVYHLKKGCWKRVDA